MMDNFGAIAALVVGFNAVAAMILVCLARFFYKWFDKRLSAVEVNVAKQQNGTLTAVQKEVKKIARNVAKLFTAQNKQEVIIQKLASERESHRLGELRTRADD